MKMTTLKSVAIAVGLASSAFGQATSPVVGYETLALGADQFNLIGQRLFGKELVNGTLTGVAGSVFSDTASDFSGIAAGATVVIELTSGNAAGFTSLATISGADVTTTTDLSAGGAAAGDTFTIREAASVQSLFGDVPPATLLTSAGNEAGSDVIFIPDGSGGFTRIFFQTPFIGAPRYFNASANAVVTDPVPIPPTSGFFVQKRGNSAELVISGDLKTDSSIFFEALSGFTPLSSVFPVGTTLQNSGLDAVLTSAGNEAGSDVVFLTDGSGGFTRYFFQTPFIGAPRFFNASANAVVTEDVPMTAGFFIQSRDPNTTFIQFNSDQSIYAGL